MLYNIAFIKINVTFVVSMLEEYKKYLLTEVKKATILVELKMELLDIIDEMIDIKADDIFLNFRQYKVDVQTYRTFLKNKKIEELVNDGNQEAK